MDFPAAAYVRTIVARQASAAADDVDLYPTSPLQQVGFFILFFFPFLAMVFVFMRIRSRMIIKQFGWDDTLICFAMSLSIAETGASYMAMKTSYIGIHIYDIPKTANLEAGFMWNYIIQLLYNPILAIVKSSVLVFMLRLGGHKPSLRYAIHALNTFNVMHMIAIFVVVIFQCSPISYFWERVQGPTVQGTCIDSGAFLVASVSLAILTDVLVLALPLWVFLGLKMAFKVKMALIAVFMIGLGVTIVSVLRLLWIIDTSLSFPTGDYTYDIRFTYSAAETNLAIISASGPTLRPLFVKWFPHLFPAQQKYPYSNSSNRYDGLSRGTSDARSRRGDGNDTPFGTSSFAMKDLRRVSPERRGATQLRGESPSNSEEEIMTYNGIIRTTEVQVQYDRA